jgi:endonuclease YncB( thermonuclease family)
VFGRQVIVHRKTIDRYGRTIGHVLVDGRDVNLEMLEEGMAWHYKHFDHNARMAAAETTARDTGKGLWSEPQPVAPWEWRQRSKAKPATSGR